MKDKRMNTQTKVEPVSKEQTEKLEHLDKEIQAAQEEGDETYLNYLLRIREMTINVYEGGTVIFQTGKPPTY